MGKGKDTPVTIVGGETVEAAIRAIRAAKTKGATMPNLAAALGVGHSTMDNHVRRLVAMGLVEACHGTAEDMEGKAGRPPNRYTWAGRPFKLVALQDFWGSQKSDATKTREARTDVKGKTKTKAKPKAAPERAGKATGRAPLTDAQRAAKNERDRARRAAAKAATVATGTT